MTRTKKIIRRLLKNGHLRRFSHPSSLRGTGKYASFLRISGALHLTIFELTCRKITFSIAYQEVEQSEKYDFFPEEYDLFRGLLILKPLNLNSRRARGL